MLEFLSKPYDLGSWDCYSIVIRYYESLGVRINTLPYLHSKDIYSYTLKDLDRIFGFKFKRVSLDKLEKDDILVFTLFNRDNLCHFGIFIPTNKMLHIEEGRHSTIEELSDAQRKRLRCGLRCITN